MKKIFVTGGAGFIGSAFVCLILEENSDTKIINFDALTYAGNPENLIGLDKSRHEFVKGDICDKEAVLNALPEGCEAIFNFAAESHVDRSISSANEFITTNVLGTQTLLDAARAKNVRRFVQISTDEVMGSLPEDETAFFTEESPLQPNSPYAASKAAAEHFVRAARETFGLDTIITRCGNNYGPRQFPEKLIPLMIANAINNEPLPVYGDGQNVRDWIFVEDHCRAIRAAFEKGEAGGIYNILDALGKPHSLIKFVTDRLGHDRRYAIDAERAEKELNWKPQMTWEKGLQTTIQWYLDNQDWVNHVRSGAYRDYYRRQYGFEIAA
jgi:dTDP-glucose 4,6-dehydratase